MSKTTCLVMLRGSVCRAFGVSIFASLIAACTPPIDEAKFEPAFRSAKSILAAREVGLTYADFSQALRLLATDLSMLEESVSTEAERARLARYESLLSVYKDINTLWGAWDYQHEGPNWRAYTADNRLVAIDGNQLRETVERLRIPIWKDGRLVSRHFPDGLALFEVAAPMGTLWASVEQKTAELHTPPTT